MGLFSNNIQYAGGFIEQEDGPVMIAMLDGIGMNGLYFHLYICLLYTSDAADE